jgi:hypothetical protein
MRFSSLPITIRTGVNRIGPSSCNERGKAHEAQYELVWRYGFTEGPSPLMIRISEAAVAKCAERWVGHWLIYSVTSQLRRLHCLRRPRVT